MVKLTSIIIGAGVVASTGAVGLRGLPPAKGVAVKIAPNKDLRCTDIDGKRSWQACDKLCMDYDNGHEYSSINDVYMYPCNSQSNQQWVGLADGTVKSMASNNLCLDYDVGHSYSKEDNVYMHECIVENGEPVPQQRWTYNAATGTVSNAAAPGLCLDYTWGMGPPSKGSPDSNLYMHTCTGKANQQFVGDEASAFCFDC